MIDIQVECEQCGMGLETVREFNNDYPLDGICVTVNPCSYCLQQIKEDFQQLLKEYES